MSGCAALLVEFSDGEKLLAAARALRARGFDAPLQAYTPYPVAGLARELRVDTRRIGWAGIAGGAGGLIAAYALQIGTNLDFPIDIGGRPLIALQSFALIGFELLVLGAVLAMVVTFFVTCGLPRYHHPLFDLPTFERATRHGFFLEVPAPDAPGRERALTLLADLGASAVQDVDA